MEISKKAEENKIYLEYNVVQVSLKMIRTT